MYAIKSINFPITVKEEEFYREIVQEKIGNRAKNISEVLLTKVDEDHIEMEVVFKETVKFERIRRVTGYLNGSIDHWCDGKKAELADRIKHSV